MTKKRIAIFGVKYFPSKGGTSRVVEHLLRELHEQYDFTVYCYKHPKAAAHIPGVRTVQFREIPIKGFGVFLYYIQCCWHLMRCKEYDLVHLHKMDAAFFLPILCLKYSVIATCHALPYLNEKWSTLARAYFRLTERMFLSSKATLTAISQPQTAYFAERYQRAVRFIPNGIHPPKEIQKSCVDDLLAEHQVADDYLLFAARRVIPLKGCHTLIKALRKINYQGTLVVAGDLEQLPSYTHQLRQLADGLDVRFIGYVDGTDRLNAVIHRSKYFVFPSELEGMSMMLLEAGSIGTPMICSDIPQNQAVLGSEEVLYFKSKNVDDLAEKLVWAFEHPREMNRLAEKTQASIRQNYLISKVVGQYAALYDQMRTSVPTELTKSYSK